jgi:hypothetical protein
MKETFRGITIVTLVVYSAPSCAQPHLKRGALGGFMELWNDAGAGQRAAGWHRVTAAEVDAAKKAVVRD